MAGSVALMAARLGRGKRRAEGFGVVITAVRQLRRAIVSRLTMAPLTTRATRNSVARISVLAQPVVPLASCLRARRIKAATHRALQSAFGRLSGRLSTDGAREVSSA